MNMGLSILALLQLLSQGCLQTRPNIPPSGAASLINSSALSTLPFASSETNPWTLMSRGHATWHGANPFLSITYAEGTALALRTGSWIAPCVIFCPSSNAVIFPEHSTWQRPQEVQRFSCMYRGYCMTCIEKSPFSPSIDCTSVLLYSVIKGWFTARSIRGQKKRWSGEQPSRMLSAASSQPSAAEPVIILTSTPICARVSAVCIAVTLLPMMAAP